MRNEYSYMVCPRSALSVEKLTLETPSFSAFENTFVSAGTTSDLAQQLHAHQNKAHRDTARCQDFMATWRVK